MRCPLSLNIPMQFPKHKDNLSRTYSTLIKIEKWQPYNTIICRPYSILPIVHISLSRGEKKEQSLIQILPRIVYMANNLIPLNCSVLFTCSIMVVFHVRKKQTNNNNKTERLTYTYLSIWNIVNALLPITRPSKMVLYPLVLFVPISHLVINTLRARRDTVIFVSLLIYT